MDRIRMITLSSPQAGRDEAYNRWYDHQHIGDVLRVPGVLSAKRFSLAPGLGAGRWRYMAVFDLASTDTARVLGDLQSRLGTDAMPMTDAIDPDSVSLFFATPQRPQRD